MIEQDDILTLSELIYTTTQSVWNNNNQEQLASWQELDNDVKNDYICEVKWFCDERPNFPDTIYQHRYRLLKLAGWSYGEDDYNEKKSSYLVGEMEKLTPLEKLELNLFFTIANNYLKYLADKTEVSLKNKLYLPKVV